MLTCIFPVETSCSKLVAIFLKVFLVVKFKGWKPRLALEVTERCQTCKAQWLMNQTEM